MQRLAGLLLLLALAVAGAVLSYFNATPVRLDYLAGTLDAPLIVWLLSSLLLGAGLAAVFGGVRRLSLQLELRRLRRQLEQTEAELKNLRRLPADTSTAGRG